MVSAGWIAVVVRGIGAVVGPVDIYTGEDFGASTVGLGARDAVVGVAVCGVGVCCAGPRGADAADEEVAGVEAVDFVVCVHGFVGVGADEVKTAGYVVGVVEDGFVVGTVGGGARGAAVGAGGRGCGWSGHCWRWCCTSGSGHWWRWCCSSGSGCCGTSDRIYSESGRGLGIFLVGIHISAVEITVVVVDSRDIVLGVATIRRSKAHANAASKRVTVFHAP